MTQTKNWKLSELKKKCKALDCTINDLFLAALAVCFNSRLKEGDKTIKEILVAQGMSFRESYGFRN